MMTIATEPIGEISAEEFMKARKRHWRKWFGRLSIQRYGDHFRIYFNEGGKFLTFHVLLNERRSWIDFRFWINLGIQFSFQADIPKRNPHHKMINDALARLTQLEWQMASDEAVPGWLDANVVITEVGVPEGGVSVQLGFTDGE